MTELVEFLKARLDEDEAVARAIDDKQLDSGWGASYNGYGMASSPVGWYVTPHIGFAYEEEGARHIARNDPARVLREIAAKRAIIADWEIYADAAYPDFEGGFSTAMDGVVDELARVYSDHHDFKADPQQPLALRK